MMIVKKILIAAALTLGLSISAGAATEGKDYEVLPKSIPQQQANKIEVLEFFGYFCPHCQHFEPILEKHARQFDGDTYLRTVHVVWDDERDTGLARLAVAVNQTGQRAAANSKIFQAFREQGVALNEPDTARKWLATQTSFNGKKVLTAYDSFSNPAQAKQMGDITRAYNITGTPTLIVGGKYKVLMNDFESGMKTVDELVAKIRAERGLKKPVATAALKSKGASLAALANK